MIKLFPYILIFLGALTAFGPFVTDMYLPTFPAMAEYFSATPSMVQLGLTFSMIGLAFGQLIFGPLSDRYGRRPPLLVAMFLFMAATVGCIYSRSIMQFAVLCLDGGFWAYETMLVGLLASLGLTFTASNTLAMDAGRECAGTASALLGAAGFIFGGAVSVLAGIGNVMVSAGILFVVCSACALVCTLTAGENPRFYLKKALLIGRQ